MARKVFFSVLGTGYYSQTTYLHQKGQACTTRFIQVAHLSSFSKEWNKADKGFIFLTSQAREFNFISPAQQNSYRVKEGDPTYPGLKDEIAKLNLPFALEGVAIPDGNNTEEIWKIFATVYEQIEEGDELYFDITHSFRSIPMLIMVLINYAKLLKNISVKSISYGNFEGRNRQSDTAPIVDITPFSDLQDWTQGTRQFIKNGNVDELTQLISQSVDPIVREAKGSNQGATAIKLLSRSLNQFTQDLQTNRSKSLFEGKTVQCMVRALEEADEELIPVFKPILRKIKESITPFNVDNNILVGLEAIKWTYNNGLIQQAITMADELLTTFLCAELQLNENSRQDRSLVKSALTICYNKMPEADWKLDGTIVAKKGNISEEEWQQKRTEKHEICRQLILNKHISGFAKTGNTLTDLRNDINHAGMVNNPSKADKLKQNVKQLITIIDTQIRDVYKPE